jgi:hypothetical protein
MSNQSQIISSGPIGEPKAYALEVFMYKGDASQQEAIQKMKVHVHILCTAGSLRRIAKRSFMVSFPLAERICILNVFELSAICSLSIAPQVIWHMRSLNYLFFGNATSDT